MFEGHVVGGFPGSTFKVQMTDQQRLLYDEMYCKQSVMLPHDIISSLYDFPEIYHPLFTGEPGRIEWYWGQNMDLFESLGDPNLEAWLVVISVPCLLGLFSSICWLGSGKKNVLLFNLKKTKRNEQDLSTLVPLRLYGDGADAQQHFEIMTILPVLASNHSTLDSRILCSVRNTYKTTTECRRQILEVLAWSFKALRPLINLNPWLFLFGTLPKSMDVSMYVELTPRLPVWLSRVLIKVMVYTHMKTRGA